MNENNGHENDGPSKLQGMKLTDQCAGCEITGHENDRSRMMAGLEVAGEQIRVLTEIKLQWSVQIFKPKTL